MKLVFPNRGRHSTHSRSALLKMKKPQVNMDAHCNAHVTFVTSEYVTAASPMITLLVSSWFAAK